MNEFTKKKCRPCEGGIPPLSQEEIQKSLFQLKGWELSSDTKTIIKNLKLKDFKSALKLVNEIGVIAESEGHHPNLYIHRYKLLRIELNTHAIDGLSENDFILAAKIDELIG